MLKAYSHIESENLDSGIVDRHIQDREKQIISEFVRNNPSKKTKSPCVFCNSSTGCFDTIDEVYYQRCNV